MKKPTGKRPNFFKRLNAPYRVVFIDDESLEEVATFNLTKRRMYMMFSTLFVVTVFITVLILLLSPLKYYLPGYGGDNSHFEVVKLKQQVDSLADLTRAQQDYAANIRKVISGKEDGERDTAMLDINKVRTEALNSILPDASDIKEQAMQEAAKENTSSSPKKRKRRR